MSRASVWSRRWWVWAVPALVLVANLAWFMGFRRTILQRGTALESQVEKLQTEVSQLEALRRKLDDARSRLADLRVNLDVLRREELSGMRERLVPFIQEVVRIGEEAGLGVERVSYAYRQEDKTGLVYFSASYAVKGTYEQIRRCVYLLESSPHFIVLEGLALTGDPSSASLTVSVQLTMGTYFSRVDADLVRELGIKEVVRGSQD